MVKFLFKKMQSELEMHTKLGSLTTYSHYGSDRSRDSRALVDYDVVLTTYGVLSSEFTGNEVNSELLILVLVLCLLS